MINKLLDMFGYSKKSSPFSPSNERFFSTSTNTFEITNTQAQLDAYETIKWVGHMSEIRAEEIGATDWGIFKGDNEIDNTKAHILLNNPHPSMNTVQFLKTLVYHIDLTGNAFILKNQNNALAEMTNKPSELVPWIPSQVNVIDENGKKVEANTIKSGGHIINYELKDNGNMATVMPEMVEQINAGSPKNILRGMGIIQRNSQILESEKIQDVFDRTFLEKGLMLKMVVSVDDSIELVGDGLHKANREFREQYARGKETIAVLPAGMKAEFPKISYAELDMIERAKLSKEDITTIFRIPRIKVGLETKYRSVDGELIEWEKVKASLYSLIESSLTNIVVQIMGEGYEFRFKRETVVDFDKQLKKVQTGNFTVADNQRLLGEPVDEKAPDIYTTTINTIPYDDIGFSTEEESKSCGCGTDHINKETPGGFDQRRATSKEKLRIHRIAKRTKDKKIQGQVLKDTNSYYRKFEKSVLNGFDEATKSYQTKEASADDVFNFPELRAEGLKSANSMFTSAVMIGIDDNNAIWGTAIDSSTKNARLRLVVDKLSVQYVDVTLNSRVKELRKLFTKGVSDGLSIPELRDNVTKYMDTLTDPNGYRAMRIARTEASNAWDEAARLSYQELDVKTFDVVGCEDNETDCNAVNVPMAQWNSLVFHPSHTGTRVANV